MVFVNRRRGAAADPNTVLLLHGNSLQDASMYKRQMTNNGVTISSAQSHFGGSSLYFNGSAYFEVFGLQDFPHGTADFTIDFWWMDTGTDERGAIVSHAFPGHVGYGSLFYYLAQNNWQMFTTSVTGEWDGLNSTTIGQRNQAWTHYALVRHNTTFLAFQNGTLLYTLPDSTAFGVLAESLLIGKYDYTSGSCSTGYMEEMRLSNIARWTSDFTPPTAPY